MISFEQANKIAKKIMPKADVYQEYSDVYIFFIKNPTKNEMWDNEVVVSKKDGKVISYTDYIMSSKK